MGVVGLVRLVAAVVWLGAEPVTGGAWDSICPALINNGVNYICKPGYYPVLSCVIAASVHLWYCFRIYFPYSIGQKCWAIKVPCMKKKCKKILKKKRCVKVPGTCKCSPISILAFLSTIDSCAGDSQACGPDPTKVSWKKVSTSDICKKVMIGMLCQWRAEI